MHDNDQFLIEAMRAGASGYVLKTEIDRSLVSAVRSALDGAEFVYPQGAEDRIKAAVESGATSSLVLTSRESEVLKLIAEGLSTREMAGRSGDQREDRRHPPGQPSREARDAQSGGTDALRDQAGHLCA